MGNKGIMDKLKLILHYIGYKLFARHKYGHGIHSPFVFDLITNVFNDRYEYPEYNEVEKIRKIMCSSEKIISLTDYGAGSHKFKSEKIISPSNHCAGSHVSGSIKRKLRKIARYSSVSKKYGELLFRIVRHFKPGTVLELGASAGISTMYLAKGSDKARVISIEANKELAEIAGQNFQDTGVNNVTIVNDSFENALPGIIKQLNDNVIVFIDGNHKKEATVSYFRQLLEKADDNWIMIFDDINWSGGMREAWKEIKSDPESKISIDLFYMGVIFFNKGVQKQNFVIRF